MTLNFPAAPASGATHNAANGLQYTYDGVKWTSQGAYATGLKDIVKLDNIASQFDGSRTSFNLTVNSVGINPLNAESLTISLGGVIQEPQITDDNGVYGAGAYSVNSATGVITFASAPAAGTTFYGVLQSRLPIGTLSDGAVTNAKVNSAAAIDATKLSFTQTGTGAVARTVDSKLGDVVSVKDFGAVGNGTTDDTTAFQNAVDAGFPKIVVPDGRYLIESADLTIPPQVSLVTIGATPPDSTERFTLDDKPIVLILGNNKKIILENSASVKGLTIIQKTTYTALAQLPSGQPLTINDVNKYSGTAIECGACPYIGYCLIIGFDRAIDTLTANTPRGRLEYLMIDCINGVRIDQDLGGWDLYNVHCGPVATNKNNNYPIPDTDNVRTGIGIEFKNLSDWSTVTNCFTFNNTGFKITECNSIKFVGCGADNPRTTTGTVGFSLNGTGTCRENMFIGCQTAAMPIGIYQNVPDNHRNLFLNTVVWSCNRGIDIVGGDASINSCSFRNILNSSATTSDGYAIKMSNANSRVLVNDTRIDGNGTGETRTDLPTGMAIVLTGGDLHVDSCHFEDIKSKGIFINDANAKVQITDTRFITMPVAIDSTAYSEVITRNNFYESVNILRTNEVTKSVPSAGTVTLPNNDILFEITGSIDIGTLTGNERSPNSIVILNFTGALTLNHNSNGMNLAGGVDASITAGSTITLVYVTGNKWFELSRSIV